MVPWIFILGGILLGTAQAQQKSDEMRHTKGIYGTDDRTDESLATQCVGETCSGNTSPELRARAAASTVALVPIDALTYDEGTNSFIPTSSGTLATSQGLCDDDPVTGAAPRFADQPVPSSCSGTVVQWDPESGVGLVASAGHCFDDNGDVNGCQTRTGGVHPFPPRTTACVYSGDSECDDGADGGAYCAVGTDDDCPSRPVEAEPCDYYFVFDFTDETLAPLSEEPGYEDECSWPADGECDSQPDADGNVYCPTGSDSCDCLGTNCPTPANCGHSCVEGECTLSCEDEHGPRCHFASLMVRFSSS